MSKTIRKWIWILVSGAVAVLVLPFCGSSTEEFAPAMGNRSHRLMSIGDEIDAAAA
jgi:hypothetical protein